VAVQAILFIYTRCKLRSPPLVDSFVLVVAARAEVWTNELTALLGTTGSLAVADTTSDSAGSPVGMVGQLVACEAVHSFITLCRARKDAFGDTRDKDGPGGVAVDAVLVCKVTGALSN
jgi:hypothetical protein